MVSDKPISYNYLQCGQNQFIERIMLYYLNITQYRKIMYLRSPLPIDSTCSFYCLNP